jgi:hypothetical protein
VPAVLAAGRRVRQPRVVYTEADKAVLRRRPPRRSAETPD